MKKIVFILPNLNGGGVERVVINYLRQLDLTKYYVTLVVLDKTADLLPLIPDKIDIIDLCTKSVRFSFFAFLKTLRKLKPDVVYTGHSRMASMLMLIKPFVPRFKHIARMQSMPSLEKKYASYSFFHRMIYSAGFKIADIVVAETKAMKSDAIQIFGIKSGKIIVMSNPLDTEHIKRCLGESTPFPPRQISAIAAGRLAYAKGYDVLIKSLPLVIEKHPDFMLYILGSDQGEGTKLRALAEQLNLEKYVMFMGFQPNPYPYYRFCDLFILSSRWEGFPNVFIENYYLNTPIVATSCVPVLGEMIKNGINGYLCDCEDEKALASAILDGLSLRRENINNKYVGGFFEDLLK